MRTLLIEVTNAGAVLNGTVLIVTTDIVANNGIIHVIDAVLLPQRNKWEAKLSVNDL